MDENCSYYNALHWDNGHGALLPLDNSDPNGTAFQFGSSTCSFTYQSSTQPYFTYGEIVNSIFLFLILMTGMVICFHVMFRKIKIKNQ
jgi:hypothetical protein